MDFHRSLAQASGNATVAEVVESVTVVNAREQLEILHIHGDRQADLDEHHAIYDAVRAGDRPRRTASPESTSTESLPSSTTDSHP